MKRNIFREVLLSLAVVMMLAIVVFPAIEPGIIGAATTGQIEIKQQVTSEISLTVDDTSITMLPAIPGLTGGTGYGSTTVNVVTNNTAGYTLTIKASSSPSLVGDTQGGSFGNFNPGGAPIAWVDNTSGQPSQFGFTIVASSTSTVEPSFDIGDGFGGKYSEATTTERVIIITSSETLASGSTSTLAFRAHIPPNPSPAVPEDWYTATTTLTATMN